MAVNLSVNNNFGYPSANQAAIGLMKEAKTYNKDAMASLRNLGAVYAVNANQLTAKVRAQAKATLDEFEPQSVLNGFDKW